MSSKPRNQKGFTLLEILLVIGIIAILAGIVIVAINPGRQLATVRNTQRQMNLGEINKALQQYYIDNNHYVTGLTTTSTEICDTGTASTTHSVTCGSLIDLSALVPTFMVAIPTDPSGAIATNGTGYKIALNSSGKIYLQANQAENSAVINLGGDTGVAGTDWDIPAGWVSPTPTGTLRYWVATSAGSWNDTANWSTTSGGTPGASVPGLTNDAIFDGEANGNCTVNATVNVKGLILEGYHGTITQGSYAVTVGTDGYVQGSGTFAGSASAVTINGQYVQGGGTFTSTSGSLTVAGNFTKSGGVFTHNSGAVIFQVPNGSYTITTDVAIFNNVTFTGGSNTGFTLADDFTVVNDLTINMTGADVNNNWIRPSGTRVITLQGNFIGTDLANDTGTGGGGFGSSSLTIQMTGDSKSFIQSQGTFVANLNLFGSGMTTMNQTAGFFIRGNTTTINQSSGSVQLGSVFNFGALNLTVGDFFGTQNYDMTIKGSFVNSGTLTLGSSDITIQGPGGITLTTAGIIFNDLILNGSSHTSITITDDFTILGNLTVNMTGADANNNWIRPSGVRTIVLLGNFIGTNLAGSGFGTSNLTLELSGNSMQTLTLLTGTFYSKLTIAKSGGSALLGSNFTVTSPAVTTINAGSTFNLMGYTLTGTLVNNGTLIP